MVSGRNLLALAACSLFQVQAIDLDVNSDGSVKSAASSLASGLLSFYNGNEPGNTPGLLSKPYYWWEAGALFDGLIQYWHLTGDDSHNDIVTQALLFQRGANNDYLPANQSQSLGNDDQSTWGLAALSAAEAGLPTDGNITWFELADAVFNSQVPRWDTESCGGGLRWQIFTFNSGYNYKNTPANGQFFELASRLARYTGNSTYSEWASKAYEWSKASGLVSSEWAVYDGSQVDTNCSAINHIQLSWSAAVYIDGAANMYNITTGDEQTKWRVELDGLLNTTFAVFFPDEVAVEISCELNGRCNVDMRAFKGLLAHKLINTIQVAPYTARSISSLLKSTAEAAAKACTDASHCPLNWTGNTTSNDENTGVGEVLGAMTFVQGLLAGDAPSLLKHEGTSVNGTSTSPGSAPGSESPAPTVSGSASPTLLNGAGGARAQTAGLGLLVGLWGIGSWLL